MKDIAVSCWCADPLPCAFPFLPSALFTRSDEGDFGLRQPSYLSLPGNNWSISRVPSACRSSIASPPMLLL